MLRRLAILTLSLLIIPVQAYAQTNQAKDAAKGNNPSPPIAQVAIQDTYGQKLQPKDQAHIQTDVRVVSAPTKDHYDKAAVWINLALAVVGFLGVGVGVCTVLFIKAQVIEMRRQRVLAWKTLGTIRRQAKVMEDGLVLTRAKERARLTVTPKEFKAPGIVPFDFSTLIVEVTNDGFTNALNVVARGEIETIKSQPDPTPDKFMAHRIPSTLKAGATALVEFTLTDEHALDDLPPTHYGNFVVRVVGIVEYDDVFGDCHTTAFSYRIDPYQIAVHDLGIGNGGKSWTVEMSDGWVKFGPPEANRAT